MDHIRYTMYNMYKIYIMYNMYTMYNMYNMYNIYNMYVCLSVCMSVCMYVCLSGWMDGWVYGCMDVWMYGCMDACMHVWMYGCMDVWMYGCMDAWMFSHITIHSTSHPAEKANKWKQVKAKSRWRWEECAVATLPLRQCPFWTRHWPTQPPCQGVTRIASQVGHVISLSIHLFIYSPYMLYTYHQRKLGSNTSVLRTNRILRLEMMQGGRSHNNT